MTKAPTPTEKSKKQRDIKNATKNFNYTTIADRSVGVLVGTPTGVVKRVYERLTFPLTTTAM